MSAGLVSPAYLRDFSGNPGFFRFRETQIRVLLRTLDCSKTLATPHAASAPIIWAATKPPISTNRIPAKVCVNARANVTAGLANYVLAVNQYAAKM